MTTPQERTRALIFAHEVLSEMFRAPDVSAQWKRQIEVVLRHYPDPVDIQAHAQRVEKDRATFAGPWLLPWTTD